MTEHSDFEIIDLGIQEEWVYDIEVEDNHNFFGNDILVHNSAYFHIAPFVEKAFKDYPDADIQTKVDFCDKFVKEIIDPCIEDVNREFTNCLNAFDKDVIKTEREAIADVGIHLAKKKYLMRVYDNEGTRFQIPKKKTMGIEIVRSSTPKWSKEKLTECIDIILDNTEADLKKWIDSIKSDYITQSLDNIAKTTSIGSLAYDLEKDTFKEGKKVTIPINSRAALAYNRYINQKGISGQYLEISVGDKVKLMYMNLPNPSGEKALAFIDPQSVDSIKEYVDYDTNFDKFFLTSLEIMTAPLGWNLRNRANTLEDW